MELYNYEAGYDSPEQEYEMTMQAGRNEAEFTLIPGAERPEMAQLRFFTLDRAGYSLEDVRIYGQTVGPKVPVGSGWLWCCV